MNNASLSDRIKGLKLVAFDFDGVFTDGRVIVDQHGNESVICSRKDTLRFPEVKQAGIQLVVISKEKNPVVEFRCRKMDVECFQGVADKFTLLKSLVIEKNLSPNEVAFVGDDINDLPCFGYSGVAFTVADGHKKCQAVADYITSRPGGDHAVREICDLILDTRNTDQ